MTHAAAALSLHRTSIGKKALMAITGVVLFGFVIGHMIGNLQIFLGREALNAYAEWLHAHPGLLWSARLLLLGAVVVHMASAATLWRGNRRARGIPYRRQVYRASNAASRSMAFGGVAIFGFVIYHLLHFTWGTAHLAFVPGDVYCNVVTAFSRWWVVGIYVAANVFLGLHLYHGTWSIFQTLSLSTARWERLVRRMGAIFTAAIVVGNVSIPIAGLMGLIPGACACS